MREIIFRGKCINNIWGDKDGWIYGSFVDTREAYSKKQHCFIVDADYYDHEEFEVCPPTVGQYTGLTDKNGKKIFEGDIVRRNSINLNFDYVVAYNEELAEFELEYIKTGGAHACFHSTFGEVIGNIYDNPELLDSDKKGGTE